MIIRFSDFLLSLIAISLLAPLLLVVCVILYFTGEGEIFYLQKRVGYKGKEFFMFKFATMVKDSPNIGAGDITLKEDDRVLPVGKVLRKTKINELPQVLNVLLGDMSFVGPRPMVPASFFRYGESAELISSVRPGVTGLGSIIFRDEEAYLNHENSKEFYFNVIHPYKAQLEIWFVENYGVRLYLKIFFLTIIAILFPKLKLFDMFTGMPSPPSELNLM